MREYEARIDLRKNGTYTDGTEFPATFIICADNLREAKDFAWEVFVSETKTFMRREMCKVEVSRI